MEIGEYARIDDIHNSKIEGWVVIYDLRMEEKYDSPDGGTIAFIEPTKAKAGNRAAQLYKKGVRDCMTIMGGGLGELYVGGIFVK